MPDPAAPLEVQEVLVGIRSELPALREAVDHLAQRLNRGRRFSIILSGIVAVLALVILVAIIFVARNRSNLTCIRQWANATSARADKISTASQIRLDAEDQLNNASIDLISTIPVIPGKMADPKAFYKALAAYQREGIEYRLAKARYDKVVADNPVPTSYNCRNI